MRARDAKPLDEIADLSLGACVPQAVPIRREVLEQLGIVAMLPAHAVDVAEELGKPKLVQRQQARSVLRLEIAVDMDRGGSILDHNVAAGCLAELFDDEAQGRAEPVAPPDN